MAVDWVNVTSTEPGAAGNGRADDTLALQRAIAYVNEIGGGFVYLPDALTTPVRL
jgi:polygalacturonase